jgi:uncharacterized protein YneF (UPF0154 family)
VFLVILSLGILLGIVVGILIGLWLADHLNAAPLVDVDDLAAQRGAEWADGKR